jgi:hypothetical protein
MTSLFQVIAHEDNNDQTKFRQAMALATERVNDRFGSFVRQGSVDDQAARWSLIEEDVKAVVVAACKQVGHGFYGDSVEQKVAAGIYDAIANNFVTADAASQLRTASVRHEARKPKMCPYHSEVTDISLAQGEPQAGFNAMAQHAWGEKHCQGEGYKGDKCKFKPAMTTQSYWDERSEKLEEKRQERAEREEQEALQAEQVNELPEVEIPEEPITESVPSDVLHDGFEGGEPVAEAPQEIPMSMAARTATKEHLKGVDSDKRQRQYEHIKEQCLADGGSEDHCKELAARTVNKQRAEHGETKSHVASPTTGLGEAVPKMDKRKWTPKTVPHDQPLNADEKSGPNPTRRKDVIEPILPKNGDDLDEIGEGVTERQDVTQKSEFSRGDQGGSQGTAGGSAVSGLLDTNSVRQALAKFKR